jgi:HSP20 family protein
MSLIPKDSLDWLNLFRQQMTTLFRYLSQIEERDYGDIPEFSPALDIFETAERFVVEVDLPGAEIADLKVSLCCSLLVIEGQKRQETMPKNGRLHCLERRYGRFCRTLEIPPGCALDQVHACFRRGVLTISLPRLSATRPVVREIAIEQGDV